MAEIISTTPNDLLENFQTAYYNQMGRRMIIGSEEYTLSSIFTYVLAYYSALINTSYANQNIETASGEFLDNIGARYNLSRTPEVYSNPWFEGIFDFSVRWVYYGRNFNPGELTITVADHQYSNYNSITAATTDVKVRFVATEAHTDYLSKVELHSALYEVIDINNNPIFTPPGIAMWRHSSLQDVAVPMSDDEYRIYIKNNKKLYTPGVAGSFESLAKTSSEGIIDARVRIQGDPDFTPGYVDLYCKPIKYYGDEMDVDYSDLIKAIDIPNVANVVSEENITTVGQTVRVNAATEISDSRNYRFFVPEAYHTSAYETLYNYKFKAACGWLNTQGLKINESYIPSVLVSIMSKPLSELSNNPDDFGLPNGKAIYLNFDKYKDLPVIGLESLSNYVKNDANPTSYIWISESSTVGFVYI